MLRIVNTLNQAASGTTAGAAFSTPGKKLVTVVAHDTQITPVAGLMRADWSVPTFAWDDATPGGAIVFELRQNNADNSYVVRTYFATATMDQQHDATPFSLQTPPAIAPIFVPNASGGNTYFDSPLSTFTSTMMSSLNTKFTN